jgi:multiple sugar transport system permease protein
VVQLLRKRELALPNRFEEQATAYSMALPAILIIVGLGIFPVGYTIWLSLQKINPVTFQASFLGLNNYVELLRKAGFWSSLELTFYFTIVSITLQITLGMLISFLLNLKFRGRWLVRGLILVPWAVPTIVNANLWNWILNTNYGILNRVLIKMHIIQEGVAWLSDSRLAMNMVIIADTWRMLPLVIIMLLAALQTVPQECLEAATVDGANTFKRFLYVYLPDLRPMLLVILVLRTIQAFRVFDIIYVLTKGGPANETMVISFYGYYETFNFLNYGKGAAIAMIVSFVILLLSSIYMRILQSKK